MTNLLLLRVGAVASLVLSGACSHAVAPAPAAPDTPEFRALVQRLDRERGARSRVAWKGVVRARMREPRSGKVIDGRGAIAVLSDRVRMVLLGAAGFTMFDAWVTPDRWRVSVPPADVLRRGGAEDPADLPIGFLRWWFFRPLEGDVFAARTTARGPLWLLRDRGAVIELSSEPCPEGGALLQAVRRAGKQEEEVRECRTGSGPRPGDSVRYRDRSSGLEVDLVVESVADGPPDAAGLADPDTEGTPR
jgi:hypothetical protein